MKCQICGSDVPDWSIIELGTGKNKTKMCPKCYRKGQSELTGYQADRKKKYFKEIHRKNES